MGGSGSTYRPPGSGPTNCGDLAFSTAINSPENLTGLKPGDILGLKRNPQMEVQFVAPNGKTVGKLFSSHLLRIVSCMDKGFEYSATVLSIEDGVCRVNVFCSKSPK